MIPVSQEKIASYTQKGYWGHKTLLDLLEEHAATHPDTDALVDPENRQKLAGGSPGRFTWSGMLDAIDRLAAGFRSLGLGKDDVILVQLPNIAEIVLTYFAAARIGAISSPLSMMARGHELGGALKVTGARAIVSLAEFHGFDHDGMIQQVQPQFPCLAHRILVGGRAGDGAVSFEALQAMPKDTPGSGKSAIGPDDVFTICWTSGTEADPKGVPHTHNEWLAISRVVVEGCQMTPGFNIHGSFPVINMAGFGGTLIPWVITGGKFVLHHPFDQQVFFAQLAREQIDYTLMPPALLDTLAKSPAVETLETLQVKVIGSGSVPLSPWMVRFYQDRFNIGIVNFFASNEGIAFFSAPRFFPTPEDRASYFPRFGRPEVCWNVPEHVVGGMRSRLVKPGTTEEILANGVAGELCFAGPTVFAGYWNRPDLTATAFDSDGYYHTGDLFSIEGENQDKYLFRGRYKDLIIRGGQNISPEEVETLIIGHPKIQEVAAVGCPDPRLCERTCAVVVPVPGETVTLAEIVAFMEAKGVAKYKLPERLEIVERLPRNAVQKVLRRELRDWLWKKVEGEKKEASDPACL
ncbi:MAG: AMP-binding protein [Desulfobacteraceae bacterium]|jgi:acyl-CoA synthetase (AMP-forming)/AMP-acid ligase II|nr:AMP-binding protein [Desulfobacteraceae bacterium]